MEVCNIMGWNGRGLNKRDKQRSVLDVLRENKVGLGALLETKIEHDKVKEVVTTSFPNWEFYSSSVISKRIILVWQAKFVHVEIIEEDFQFVHSRVKVIGLGEEFYFTAVYGSNSALERRSLFEKLAGIGMVNKPWLILGDFNAMFCFQDRNGGKVDEIKSSGSYFTWSTKHDLGSRIFSKLDRVLLNEDWMDHFPDNEACFKWECISDHSFCIVKNNRIGSVGVRPFRFCNHWALHSKFRERTLSSWFNSFDTKNTAGLVKKLLRVKHILKKFNREEAGDIEQRYNHCKDEFILAQDNLAREPNNNILLQEEKVKSLEYVAALKQYSVFLRQQSKVSWLQNGDDNTRYFHSFLKKRRLENRITTFERNGMIVDDYNQVVEHFLNHFRNFMGKKSSATKRLDKHCINQGPVLSIEQQLRLIRPFKEKDVKQDIGHDVSTAILNFFEEGIMPTSLKDAVITLILKTQEPKDASDYRPIACCNTVYKCISKMICSRLTEVLPSLVNDNQGAFVKNRLLAHNIMIFQDLLKGYTRKNIYARCIMKIDLSKAYDTVDWQFVEDLLNSLCFPSRFIHWLLVCLRGTTYFLLLNGRIQGSFKDDLIIFCKGNMNSVELVNEAFQDFSQATGSKLHMPSWEKVCLPKQFGGIGFREGKKWNMARVAKHLWAILSKQDNLWVKWINSIYLKNQDAWSCPIKPDLSWYFKKLLKIRNVTNANMVNQAVKGNKFKVNRFYNELIGPIRTPYTATVWHKYIVPKHRFMFWQIINENLLTRDHLSRFFPIHSGLCLVCDDAPESHNHLFFECIFTRNLIVFVEKWAGQMRWPKNISELHDQVLPAKVNLASKIMNAITAAALYLLWKNRNDCLFNMVCNSVASLSKEIKSVVKARVLGLFCTSQKKKDQYVLRLLNSW
ncbi:uncharacterized protein LOC133035175 [Cannabis sativa]|uniref:uncharacterized protein LOC133035175 n=1 Tax=Cannabis sativa TaxID=3483 RepID=UPI0029CA91B3|nr:uncharacterized protein LOC133035175 [Cannabis sativa]